jgi:hypothetical protein
MTWTEFLARVDVGGALPVFFTVLDDARVRIDMTVPCVDTGALITIGRVVQLPPLDRDVDRIAWVASEVLWLYRHEADEQITLDGERVAALEHEHR